MEDDHNFFLNGRRPTLFWRNGRQPHFWAKWKTTSILRKMEDDLNFKVNGRRPKFQGKRKTTSIF